MSSSVTNTKAFLENKDAANFRNLKKNYVWWNSTLSTTFPYGIN